MELSRFKLYKLIENGWVLRIKSYGNNNHGDEPFLVLNFDKKIWDIENLSN